MRLFHSKVVSVSNVLYCNSPSLQNEVNDIPFFDVELPYELALKIFQYLNCAELGRCAQVSCKKNPKKKTNACIGMGCLCYVIKKKRTQKREAESPFPQNELAVLRLLLYSLQFLWKKKVSNAVKSPFMCFFLYLHLYIFDT